MHLSPNSNTTSSAHDQGNSPGTSEMTPKFSTNGDSTEFPEIGVTPASVKTTELSPHELALPPPFQESATRSLEDREGSSHLVNGNVTKSPNLESSNHQNVSSPVPAPMLGRSFNFYLGHPLRTPTSCASSSQPFSTPFFFAVLTFSLFSTSLLADALLGKNFHLL